MQNLTNSLTLEVCQGFYSDNGDICTGPEEFKLLQSGHCALVKIGSVFLSKDDLLTLVSSVDKHQACINLMIKD